MKKIAGLILFVFFIFSCTKEDTYKGSGINSNAFKIYPSDFIIAPDGETVNFKIEVAGGKLWVLHQIPSWCDINLTSSRYDEEIILKVAKNQSFFQRTGLIKRSVSTKDKNSGILPAITVVQFGQTLQKDVMEAGSLTKFIKDSYINSNIETNASDIIINNITLSGNINYEDIHNLKDIQVSKLDISQTNIVKGIRNSTEGSFDSPANILDAQLFSNFTNLISVKLPDVSEIKEGAFYECKLLKSLEIPESVSYIGPKAFYNCDSLKTISLPEKLTAIYDETFYNCKELDSITIPENVKTIGENAFYEVTGSIILKATTPPLIVTTLGKESFNKQESIYFYVPKGTLSAYNNTEGWKKFNHILEQE